MVNIGTFPADPVALLGTSFIAGASIAIGKGSKGPSMTKKQLPVETDPAKLVTHVCGSNIYKTGEDIKLKEDSEYPDWLCTLRTGKPPPLEELDPDSMEYWARLRKLYRRRNNTLRKGKKF